MENKEAQRIVKDLEEDMVLVKCCAGCGSNYYTYGLRKGKITKTGRARGSECGCPAGDGLNINPIIEKMLKGVR